MKKMIKKKVLRKAGENNNNEVKVKTPFQVSGPIAVLKKGTKNPSGVSREDKLRAIDNVTYVRGRKQTLNVTDFYAAVLNRVKDKCNARDLSVYESSTNDFAIRKDFERLVGELRKAGYLSPKNAEGTITLLKVIPPDLKISKNGSI